MMTSTDQSDDDSLDGAFKCSRFTGPFEAMLADGVDDVGDRFITYIDHFFALSGTLLGFTSLVVTERVIFSEVEGSWIDASTRTDGYAIGLLVTFLLSLGVTLFAIFLHVSKAIASSEWVVRTFHRFYNLMFIAMFLAVVAILAAVQFAVGGLYAASLWYSFSVLGFILAVLLLTLLLWTVIGTSSRVARVKLTEPLPASATAEIRVNYSVGLTETDSRNAGRRGRNPFLAFIADGMADRDLGGTISSLFAVLDTVAALTVGFSFFISRSPLEFRTIDGEWITPTQRTTIFAAAALFCMIFSISSSVAILLINTTLNYSCSATWYSMKFAKVFLYPGPSCVLGILCMAFAVVAAAGGLYGAALWYYFVVLFVAALVGNVVLFVVIAVATLRRVAYNTTAEPVARSSDDAEDDERYRIGNPGAQRRRFWNPYRAYVTDGMSPEEIHSHLSGQFSVYGTIASVFMGFSSLVATSRVDFLEIDGQVWSVSLRSDLYAFFVITTYMTCLGSTLLLILFNFGLTLSADPIWLVRRFSHLLPIPGYLLTVGIMTIAAGVAVAAGGLYSGWLYWVFVGSLSFAIFVLLVLAVVFTLKSSNRVASFSTNEDIPEDVSFASEDIAELKVQDESRRPSALQSPPGTSPPGTSNLSSRPPDPPSRRLRIRRLLNPFLSYIVDGVDPAELSALIVGHLSPLKTLGGILVGFSFVIVTSRVDFPSVEGELITPLVRSNIYATSLLLVFAAALISDMTVALVEKTISTIDDPRWIITNFSVLLNVPGALIYISLLAFAVSFVIAIGGLFDAWVYWAVLGVGAVLLVFVLILIIRHSVLVNRRVAKHSLSRSIQPHRCFEDFILDPKDKTSKGSRWRHIFKAFVADGMDDADVTARIYGVFSVTETVSALVMGFAALIISDVPLLVPTPATVTPTGGLTPSPPPTATPTVTFVQEVDQTDIISPSTRNNLYALCMSISFLFSMMSSILVVMCKTYVNLAKDIRFMVHNFESVWWYPLYFAVAGIIFFAGGVFFIAGNLYSDAIWYCFIPGLVVVLAFDFIIGWVGIFRACAFAARTMSTALSDLSAPLDDDPIVVEDA